MNANRKLSLLGFILIPSVAALAAQLFPGLASRFWWVLDFNNWSGRMYVVFNLAALLLLLFARVSVLQKRRNRKQAQGKNEELILACSANGEQNSNGETKDG